MYPTCYGLDADGEPAVVLTDLFVVDALNARPAAR
jgi:hypothetical protein